MKALAVSDLHYTLPQFEWLVRKAPRYDLVVIAGDLLDLSSPVDADAQIIVITRYLQRIREQAMLVVCSGNHDGDVRIRGGNFRAEWLLDVRGRNLAVDGETIPFGEDKISICPWWEGDESRAAMEEMLRAEAVSPRPWRRWYWVHHAPPNGAAVSWTGKKFGGDDVIAALIAELQPDVVFSGHIHNAPFYADGGWASKVGTTWVFNPGRQIGPIPSMILLDLDTMVAEYQSLDAEEFLGVA